MKFLAYMVMPRFGANLNTLHEKLLNTNTILDLGIRVIKMLEEVHSVGLVYNDLKLDNILIGYNTHLPTKFDDSESALKDLNLHLIDFGFCSKYRRNN